VTTTPTSPAASQQAAVDAALVVLKSMGLSPDDLTAAPRQRPAVPTFADYVPVVSATVTSGTRKACGSYWNRVTEQWGTRCLDEPTPSEIKQLVAYVRANAVPRRNARSRRGAAENLIAALRCLYKRAEDDGLVKRESAGKAARGVLAGRGRVPCGSAGTPAGWHLGRSFSTVGLSPFRCRPVLAGSAGIGRPRSVRTSRGGGRSAKPGYGRCDPEGTLTVIPRLAGVHHSRGGCVIRGRGVDAAARQRARNGQGHQ
jgi:hypothetical protein